MNGIYNMKRKIRGIKISPPKVPHQHFGDHPYMYLFMYLYMCVCMRMCVYTYIIIFLQKEDSMINAIFIIGALSK